MNVVFAVIGLVHYKDVSSLESKVPVCGDLSTIQQIHYLEYY